MNVITFFPNYHPNQLAHTSFLHPHPNLKVPPLISIISQALKASIISYEKGLISQSQTNNCEKNEPQVTVTAKIAEQQPLKADQEVKQKSTKIFKSQAGNNQLKEVVIAENSQKLARESTQLNINDSDLTEAKQNKKATKTRLLSRTIKKDKTKLIKNITRTKPSKISLLQTAQLTALRISLSELSKRRESLFQRKVIFWDQKFKERRDKRESRMLNF